MQVYKISITNCGVTAQYGLVSRARMLEILMLDHRDNDIITIEVLQIHESKAKSEK